ncbi:MAG: efflux RND transporter permease subunit [Mediterranea sp.]|nr:efflux RND transporter permease subunit [Mediterranea sp.]
MKRKINIVESAMHHRNIVFLITTLMIVLGIYGLKNIPKQEFPTFTIRQGVIVGVYPGATSAEVEEQLTKPLETFLFSYKEVKKAKTYSHSKDGIAYVFVELNDNIFNKDEVWSKLKHGLNGFKAQLPPGVLALIANDDFGDTSALLITLESENKTYRQLEGYLEILESRVRGVESVSNLRRYGLQKEQINIYLEKEKLANYGLNVTEMANSLLSQGFITIGGTIDNSEMVAPVHISKTFRSERDIEEQIVYSDPMGNIVKLKDIARVVREYPAPDSYITNNGKKCLLLSMEMRENNNIVQYGKDVDKILAEFEADLPDDVSIYRIADQPKVVGNSINTFLFELMMAILAVILVTMLLLPLRVAGVAATSIPITIFISLGIMFAFGMELNTVTLAALIVVLGMIVDNSIVIIDSYMEKLDDGVPRWHASISSAKEYFRSILSATLAIALTFFPFLFILRGQLHDFVQLFPWTILITLGVSLAVAMLLIPYMQYIFIKKGFKQSKAAKGKADKKNMLDKIQSAYDTFLPKTFKHPKRTVGLGLLSIVAAIYFGTLIPQRLMPVAERDQFAVEIYLPQGSPLSQTEEISRQLQTVLQADNRVVSVTAFNGTSSPRFHLTYAPNMPASNFAQFIVNTTSSEDTKEMLAEYSGNYANHYSNAYIRFKQLDFQSVNAEIEVRITGNSIEELKQFSDTLITELTQISEVSRVRTNFEEVLPGIKVNIDPVEAGRLGIKDVLVGTNLAVRFNGLPVGSIWEGDYVMPVKIKSEWEKKEPRIEDLQDEYIMTLTTGGSVPLRQIAAIEPEWTEGQIAHRNGVRTLAVMVDLNFGENANSVFSKAEEIVGRLSKTQLSKDLTISYGGVKESDEETLPQLLIGLTIAVCIIFFILLFHYKKISLALLTLEATTLSFFGAIFGVWVTGSELGVTSILGLVSLIGIVVRNGIIMFDYTELLRNKHGMSVYDAALDAGKRRMRPIFLTSAAASIGVIPMIISQSPLWSPMGIVICFGTLFAMIGVVCVLPVSYWLVYRNEDKKLKTVETV